jgi:DNA-binding MarR family transcriptional regulator
LAGALTLSPSAERPAVAAALAAFEDFQRHLMAVHADEFTAFDLTMAQAKLLYVVTVGGELNLSEIASRLGVTASTASGAVERLVELGLLSRTDDPSNRRQVRVSATQLGIATIEQMSELSARQLRALLATIEDGDLEVVQRAIRIMIAALGKEAGA